MKAYIYLLSLWILITLLCSCITKKQCEERCKPQIVSVKVIKDSIVCVPDTFWFEPSQITFHDTLPCPDFHGTASNGHLTATIDIKAGQLSVTCHDDSLMQIANHWKHLYSVTTHETKTSPPVIQWNTHWYDIMCRWISGILFLLMIGFFAGKYLKII